MAEADRRSRRQETLAAALLALALVAATYPAWRVALMGRAPTRDELLRTLCGKNAAPLKAWLHSATFRQ